MATFSSTMLFSFAILLLVSKSKAPVTGKPEDEPKAEANSTNGNNAQMVLQEDTRWPSEIPGHATQQGEPLQVDWNEKAKDLCSGLDQVTQSQKLAELEKCLIGTYLYLFTQANLDPANFAESVPLNDILYRKGRHSAVNNPATPEGGNGASGDVNHENTQTS